MVGREKFCLESNPILTRDAQRAQTNLVPPTPAQDPDPTETETELCLSVFCRGTGQQWTAGGAGDLGAVDLGIA